MVPLAADMLTSLALLRHLAGGGVAEALPRSIGSVSRRVGGTTQRAAVAAY